MRVKNFQETISKVQLHLNDYLQEHGINTAGMFRCINPEHDDHSPSCSTNGGDGTLFHCFSCSCAGDIFKAAHFLEDKPLGGIEWITDNLTYLANKYNIPIETTPLTDDEIYELNTYRAYKFASEYFVSHQETEAFKKVIAERNWSKELCAEFGCGTVPSFKEFRGYMKDLGFAAPFLDEIDLGRREMFDSNNFIFTIKDDIGRPVGFSSRNLDYTDDKLNGSKYVNQKTTGPRCNIYRKGSRLFGIDRLIKKQKNKSEMVYIFEGYSDVLTAVQSGLTNCVAVGGVAFTAEQLQLLKEHNFYSLCLCLDGDSAGQERMMALLDTTLGGQKDVRISLVMIPAGQDPDDIIRANGIDEFKKLRKWSAFEWRLSRFSEDADAETLCKAMVPLIVNESSSVNQEKMERILAEHTGVTQRAIHTDVEALQNTKEAERKREKQKIYDRLRYTLDRRPEEGELAIQEAQENLFDLAREHNEDSFSEEAYIAALQQQKELDEAKDGKFSGYLLGCDLEYLQNALCGNWKDKWFCIGGAENSGKTALVCKVLFEIASCEENNAICIYHTIDDTKEELNPRMVCIAERTRSLAINQVLDPNYFIKHGTSMGMLEKRERGYGELIKLVRAGRFVMKDSNDGDSLAYVERLIRYYKEKYPDRNLIYALDNFHKIRDLQTNSKDERVRFKTLSTLVKALATKYHITIISTVEYTKLPQGQKPVNNSVGECLTGDTLIFNAKNGSSIRMDSVVPGMLVATLDDTTQKISSQKVIERLDKGIRPIYQVVTKSGRTIKTTMNHPFFGEKGWTKLSDLKEKDFIAIPRKLSANQFEAFNPELARLLGYLAGDGCYGTKTGYSTRYVTPGFINSNTDYIKDVNDIVSRYFSVKITVKHNKGSLDEIFSRTDTAVLENPIVSWLKTLGIAGQKFNNKKIPEIIFKADDLAKCNYLAGLWATDGCITDVNKTQQRISYVSASYKLVQGIQRLLLSLGIQSSVHGPRKSDNLYQVTVYNKFIRAFAELIPLSSKKKEKLSLTIAKEYRDSSGDSLPPAFSHQVRRWQERHNLPVRFSDGYYISHKKASRGKMIKLLDELPVDLQKWVTSDIFWDKIQSIKYLGEEQVWDLVVENTHNFVANDIYCHNTRQVAYDANVIVHLYNDLHEFGEKATHYHIGVDSSGEQIRMPRLMADFGKNKISSFKGRVWLDFFPECSDFVSVDPRIPSEDERKAAEVKKERKGTAIF